MQLAILIPPSQAKTTGGDNPPIQPHPITKDLLKEIQQANPDKLYSGRAQEAQELNSNIQQAPTKPAITRYNGVVYKAIDYPTLPNQAYINNHVHISSALFGLIPATKNIPNYKLRITKLRAYKRWHQTNAQQLKNRFCIDLLPQAHKKAVHYEQGIEIEFTREKNGKTIKAGHAGKHIKGRFVRWLAQNNITDPQDIYAFSEDGYAWNGKTFHQTSN